MLLSMRFIIEIKGEGNREKVGEKRKKRKDKKDISIFSLAGSVVCWGKR